MAKKTMDKKTETKVDKEIKAEEIIDKDADVVEEVPVPDVLIKKEIAKKNKSYKEIRSALKQQKYDIEVEILNLDTGTVLYKDPSGRETFRMKKFGERAFILMDDLFNIVNKHRGFFEKHVICITDVDSEEFTVDDVLFALNLEELYSNIKNHTGDYIDYILKELSVDKFNKIVSESNKEMIERLAARAVALYKAGKFDSRRKEDILAEKLGKEELFYE